MIGSLDEDGVPTAGSLLAFAANELALGARQADGATLRVHLESLARQTGKIPDQLLPVDCPVEAKYLWEYFCNMSERRTSGPNGLNQITHEGVEAWARRCGVRLQPFENAALDALEGLFMLVQSKGKKTEAK